MEQSLLTAFLVLFLGAVAIIYYGVKAYKESDHKKDYYIKW